MILMVAGYGCGGRSTDSLTRGEILKKGAQLYTTHGCNRCHSLDENIV